MFDQLTASFHKDGVPPTFLVKFPSQIFNSFFGARSLFEGSTQCQKYVTYGESYEDFGPDVFSTQYIHNWYFRLTHSEWKCAYLKYVNFEWFCFPQAKEPFSESSLQDIEKIDINKQELVSLW